MMKSERLLARIVVRSIDVGILLEKRRMLLEERWMLDNGSCGKPQMRNLKRKAVLLEMQILRLEDAIRRHQAKLTGLLRRD